MRRRRPPSAGPPIQAELTPDTSSENLDRLRGEVDRGLRDKRDPDDLLPMLARLARASENGSDHWIYAHRHLAELAAPREPWRSALFARRVLAWSPDDDGAWAVFGLAQSLLGNYRCAARAYERALALAPGNPWYAHNLGHLYDVALDRPEDALPLLARATSAQTGEPEIAASYAHALARAGDLGQAKRVLKRVIRHGATSEQMALWKWLDAGAPDAPPPAQDQDPGPGAASARRKPKRRRPRERSGTAD